MGAPGFPETLESLLFCCSLLTSGFTLCNGSSDVRDFILAATSECHFLNGTQQVRYLHRYFYNQEEFVYFDSEEGRYIAKTEFGKPDADYWNKDKEIIEDEKNRVETYCKPNYGVNTAVGITDRRDPQSSDAAKNKMATGIVGFVLGVVFFIVGLVIYMRGRKGQTSFPGQQNERFLSQ